MGLELDELIYGKFVKFLKRRRLNDEEILNRQADLNTVKARMTLIARAVCGAPIDVYPAEREGGYKNNNFFLPIKIHFFSSRELNEQFYIFRTLYLCVQKELDLNFTEETFEENLALEKAKASSQQVLVKL